jgi:hypothetical protein
VLEADLNNFFGSLNHDRVLRFVEHRVGDPRLISVIRRWLKAGVPVRLDCPVFRDPRGDTTFDPK